MSSPRFEKKAEKKKLFKLRPSMLDRAIKTTNDELSERANSPASTQSEQSLKKVLNSMRKSNDDTNSRANNLQNEQGLADSGNQKATEDANICANSHANDPQNKQDNINKILNMSQQANENANNPKNAVSSTQKANDTNKQNIKKVVSNTRKANDNVSERPNTRANSRAINLQNEQNMRGVISSTLMTCTRKPSFGPSTSTVLSPICESTNTKRKATTCIQLFDNNDSPIVTSSSLSIDATLETEAKQNRLENFIQRLSNKKAPDSCNKMVQTSNDSNPKPLQFLKRLGRNCFDDDLITDKELEELKNEVIPEHIEAFIDRLDREILVNNEKEQEVLLEVNDGIPGCAPSGLQEAVIANSVLPASMEETLDDDNDDDTFLPKVLPQKKVFTDKKKVKQNLEEIISKININSRKLLENKKNEQNFMNTRQKGSSSSGTSRKEVVEKSKVFETSGSSTEEDGRCRSLIPDNEQEKKQQLKPSRRTEREVVKENKKNCEINDGTLETEGVERNTCRSKIPATSKKQEKGKKLNTCGRIEKEVVEETNKNLSKKDVRCRSPIPDKKHEKRKQLKSLRRTEREVVKENKKNLVTNEEGENSGYRSEIPATDKNQDESLFEEDNCERDGGHSSPVLGKVQNTREKLNSSGRTERKVVKESRKNLETSNCLSQDEDFPTNSRKRNQIPSTDKKQEKVKNLKSGKVKEMLKKKRTNTTLKIKQLKSTGKKQVKKPEKDEEHNIQTRSRNSKIDHFDNPTFEIVANLNERKFFFNAPEVETNVGNCSGTIQKINNSESSNQHFVDKSRQRLRVVLEPLFDLTVQKTAKASTSKTQKTKQENLRNESTSSKALTTKRKVQSQSEAQDSTVLVEGTESGVRRSGRVLQQVAFPTAGYFTVGEDETKVKKLFSLDPKYKMLPLQSTSKLSPIKETKIEKEEEEGRTIQQTTFKNKKCKRGGKSGKKNRTKKYQKRNIEKSETEREVEVQFDENEPRIESVIVNDNQSDLDSMSVRKLPQKQWVRSGRISKQSTIRKSEKKIADTIKKRMSETTNTIEIDGIDCSFKNFSFQKLSGMPGVSRSVIDDRPYGFLKIEGGKMKPSQKSGEPLWFTVVEGQAKVEIQNKSSFFKEDETFFVPQGNEYYVENMFQTKGLKLVFCSKDIIRKSN